MPYSIQAERELVHVLKKYEYVTVRSGASGGGTTLDRPDILAGSSKYKKLLAIEVKTTHKDKYSIPRAQIQALIRFATAFYQKCIPLLVVWCPPTASGGKKRWRCIQADTFMESCEKKETKTLPIKAERVYSEEWNDLLTYIQNMKQQTLLR